MSVGATTSTPTRSPHEKKSLSLVRGVTVRYGMFLERAGIRSYEDLSQGDSLSVAEQIGVSKRCVERWKDQAAVVASQRPRVKEPLPIDPDCMLILDTEHISRWSLIWLIGVRIVRDGRTEDHFLWSDGSADQLKNLRHLRSMIEDNRDLPVVTWNGTSSDLRVLQGWAARWGVRFRWPHKEVANRHLDLFRFVRDNVRLPIARLGLKEVARLFGMPHDTVRVRVPVTESEKFSFRYVELSKMRFTPSEKRFGYKLLLTPSKDRFGLKTLLTPLEKVVFEDVEINSGRVAETVYKRYRDWVSRPEEDRPGWLADIRQGLISYNRQDLLSVAGIAKHLKASFGI